MKWLALDSHGRPVAHLLAEDHIDAVLFVHRGGVPGARDVIGDNAYSDGDIKATEARLIAAFQENGLSEKEAKIAAAGRDRDRPIRDFLPTVRVPHQTATSGSASTVTNISESESHDDDRRSVELREPGSIDLASGELTELKERGVRNSVAEALADLYVGFRRSGMSKAEALVAARGRDYLASSTIREAGQELGTTPPPAYAQLMNFKASDGTETYQWRVPVCPLCQLRHLIPDPAATMDDPKAMLGEQAMPCGKGLAVLTDSATNAPPDDLYKVANPDTLGAGEAARGGDGLAEAEVRLYDSFREAGLSDQEAKIAARGRR